ncbi:MAG: hypothetical protein ACKOC8_05160, partial [Pirellulales bacterium]
MMQFLGMLGAIALTAACWGVYGPVLHHGREQMHSPLRPFVCVGVAYFVIAVVVPLLLLARGEKGAWTTKGVVWSLLAGAAGAFGALGVILALHFGGKPIYVMPLVFGGAPVINTLLSAAMNRAFDQLKAPFLAGLLLVITGAVTVLVFKPQPAPPQPAAVVAVDGVAQEAPARTVEQRAERMVAVLLSIALAMASWGAYGPVLHRGQAGMQGSRLRLEHQHGHRPGDHQQQPGQERRLELVEGPVHHRGEQRVDDRRATEHQRHHVDRLAAEVQGEDHPEGAERAGHPREQAPGHALDRPRARLAAGEQQQRHHDRDHEVGHAHAHERPQRRVHVLAAEVEHRTVHAPAGGRQADRRQHPQNLQHRLVSRGRWNAASIPAGRLVADGTSQPGHRSRGAGPPGAGLEDAEQGRRHL